MTYRVYARPRQDTPFSPKPFRRSAPVSSGYEAVEIVLAMREVEVDVFIHCDETDYIFDRQEMMRLAKD